MKYEETSEKCHLKTSNPPCHDNFENIDLIFHETALLVTVSETSKMGDSSL